ncbi:hypothetical protein [Methylorubrum zatmanii]|uniref:Uncharacterized protein n=1 Tax=Methylorubrum zatmanii TaxID=29429 RepID=A0ABW1WT81_9HYPH|nr:hypothetical protein [Methylorubrum zatmanii]MBD8905662.1 hypothetical protein [Methylorubrum zatmanii]
MRKPQASSQPVERSRGAFPPPASPAAAPPPSTLRENPASCPVEDIAQAYLTSTQGDAGIALRCAITDALSDLMEAERRARENSRLISRGYVRSLAPQE